MIGFEAILGKILGALVSLIKPLVSLFGGRRTIHLIDSPSDPWWHQGKIGDKPALQVSAHFYVSNTSDAQAHLLAAYARRAGPMGWFRPWTKGNCLVRHPTQNIYGSYAIPPGSVTEVSAHFFIPDLIVEPSKDVALRVRFIDHRRKRHRVRVLARSPAQMARPGEPIPTPRELLGAIKDRLERDIAAILQDEVQRYKKEDGQIRGKLGTVVTRLANGSHHLGILGDAWIMNTEQHPLISDPPSTVHIQSENADALVKMYYVLEGEARRRDFDVFLLSRMNRDSDYRTVAYLVVLVMKELNRLPVFLVHAKEQLAGGTGFGFNNVVRMLGSMLRASWDRFSDDELDACERFVSDLEGDSCYVRDKVAAVRAARARQSPPAAQPPAAPPLPRA